MAAAWITPANDAVFVNFGEKQSGGIAQRYDVSMNFLHALCWQLAPKGVQRERARLIATGKWCVTREMESGYNELLGVYAVESAVVSCLACWPRPTALMFRLAILNVLSNRMAVLSSRDQRLPSIVGSVGSLRNRYAAGNDLVSTDAEGVPS